MQHTILRGTGLTVSRVTLGTWPFGDEVDEGQALRMVDASLDAGVNAFDTADVYSDGRSEEILGRAIRGRRDRVVLASKVGYLDGDLPLDRRRLIGDVEASLRRLRTDFLDVCYLHRPRRDMALEETLAAFDALVREGKVRYVGLSNHAAWQVTRARWLADVHDWEAPALIQVPYSLIARSIEEECVEFSRELEVGVTAYNPLAGGLLTGKHVFERGPEDGTRFALHGYYHDRYWHETNFEAVRALTEIAVGVGKSLLELALQWVLTQDVVDSVILGASRIEQLEDNLRLSEGRLDRDVLASCDEVWRDLRGPHFRYNR